MKAAQRKPPPLPPVPNLPLPSMSGLDTAASGKENHPLPSYRSNDGCESGRSAVSKNQGYAPAPPPPSCGPGGTELGAVADYYNRRPLAPAYPLHPSNRSNIAPHRNSGGAENGDPAYKPKHVSYQPTLDPIAAGGGGGAQENNAPYAPVPPPGPPAVAYDRNSMYAHQPPAVAAQQRPPNRLQYHHNHNRVW